MRQAGSDEKGPCESLGNEIENAQSNHLTPLSRAVAPPVLKRREIGKWERKGELKNSGWGRGRWEGEKVSALCIFLPR